MDTQHARYETKSRADSGKIGRNDAGGHFDRGPANRWGESVRGIKCSVAEEDRETVGGGEDNAVQVRLTGVFLFVFFFFGNVSGLQESQAEGN